MTSALLANAFRVSFLYTSFKIPSTFFTLLGEGDWILSPIQYLGQRLDVHPIRQRTAMEAPVMHQTMAQIPWPLWGYYYLTDWEQVGSARH